MSRRLALAVALGLSVGCVTGPLNGNTTGDPVVGKSFLFQGYTDHPNELVLLEVLKTPSLDPGVDANWALFSFAHTTTSATFVNGHTDPIYYWSINAMPVASAGQAPRWPTGGLVRIRARRIDASNGNQSFQLVTFDESTFSDCFTQHFSAGEDWATIGDSCAGIGGKTIAIGSYATSPATLPAAQKPDWLGRKGDISQAETQNYYNTWGAPLTLPLFQIQYGFPNGDVHATYYNDNDLGLGREMHCRQFSAALGFGLACYVINYTGTNNVAVFDGNTDAALNDAIHHQNAFATVAMVYTPPASVNFVVYNAAGFQQKAAQLDSPNIHTSVPNNCLTCHGIESHYDSSSHSVKGPAKFLPFDPFAFKFSSVSGFTLPDQQNAFRRLNSFVKVSNPSPAIAELIDGLYEPKAVTDVTAVATDDFVPDAWEFANSSQSGTSTYKGIIKKGCRTCHISAASDLHLDFNDPDDWSVKFASIRPDVCGKTSGTIRGHAMPQAERVSKNFWASGGRSYLITGYPVSPPDGLEGCDP
jgi:hypothetical protein